MSCENSATPELGQSTGAAENMRTRDGGHTAIVPDIREGKTEAATRPARGQTAGQHAQLHALTNRCAAQAADVKAKEYAPNTVMLSEGEQSRRTASYRCERLDNGLRDPLDNVLFRVPDGPGPYQYPVSLILTTLTLSMHPIQAENAINHDIRDEGLMEWEVAQNYGSGWRAVYPIAADLRRKGTDDE